MEELTCSVNKCKNKVKYHNTREDSYYCRECAHSIFNPKDCTKIGSVSVIKQMLGLSQDLLNKIIRYSKEQQLEFKWKDSLEQLKVFSDQFKEIKEEFENIVKDRKLKNLDQIEQRSYDLKFQITESEVYKKYLFHKDMIESRFNDSNTDLDLSVTQVVKDMTEIRVYDERSAIRERIQNWRNIYEPPSSLKAEFEEFKKNHLDEIENIKQQLANEKETYEKEKEEWIAQRTEIEQELNSIKIQQEDRLSKLQNISYDVFKVLYEKSIGENKTIDSSTTITFKLNEEKWMTLLKILSNFKLPEINYFTLDYIPADSEDVKQFMKNSVSTQKQFYFNLNNQVQIEGCKYFEALKAIAKKITDLLIIKYTNFSAHEFCEILSAAKLCRYVQFIYDTIPLDSECDFGSDMEGCRIERIDFDNSGGSDYSNWKKYPARFENLIAAIAKCEPLTKSLKNIDLRGGDLTKEKAQEVLNKFKLNGIQIAGL